MKERQRIELKKEHRGGLNSTSFTGRPEGHAVRIALKLSNKDNDDALYYISMPSDTSSFNPSFYLGLFYESINKLKWENFKEKYLFDLSNMPSALREVIERNLAECERKAQNELSGIISLSL